MQKDNFSKNVQTFMAGGQDKYVLRQDMQDGYIELSNYYILSGIFLARNAIHTQMVPCGDDNAYKKSFLVNYCIDGRCEFKVDGDNYSYVDHGLMSVSSQMAQGNFYYPSSYYLGYEIYVMPDNFSQETERILKIFGINIDYLLQLYTKSAIFYASDTVLKLWDNIDECNGNCNIGQIRLDVLQILKYLYDHGPITSAQTPYLSRTQAMLVKRAKEILTADLSQHISMKMISQELGVSETSLKRYFHLVYGTNLSTYMNEIRMQYAAELLTSSRMSISDVAKACGYVNQGRFASVFRQFFGMKPLDYRRGEKL